MHRWPIWALACIALCGCQMAGGVSDTPCPSNNPCDDSDPEALGPARPSLVRLAVYELLPGCPSTIQVMARPRRIVYQAVHPDEAPEEPATEPDDSVCEGPEPGLLRASRRPSQNLAVR